MKEHFSLTLKSVKLNSPNFNLILNIDEDYLYKKQEEEAVVFFKWYSWIESTLQKEVIKLICLNASSE